MSIRCEQCGYENSEHYRFCGMCGALLQPSPADKTSPPAPPPMQAPSKAPAPSLSGPSFLGLSSEPAKRDVSYLLEDEEPHGHARLYVFLLLLIVVMGLAAWHWREQARPWVARLISSIPITSQNQVSTVAPPVANSQSPAPPVGGGTSTAPAPSQPLAAETEPAQNSSAPPPLPGADEAHMAGSQSEAAAPAQNSQPETQAPATTPQQPGAEKPAEQNTAENSPSAEQPEAEKTPPPPAKAAAARKPTVEPAAASIKPTPAPAASPDDRLVTEGENYLYGNGVPQNCSRAQRNLTSAANRASAKAMSVLGTMYATGHCVTRDLPAAYQWFAKALHQDPNNGRIQRDLEVLWRQMTPGERQVAMRNR